MRKPWVLALAVAMAICAGCGSRADFSTLAGNAGSLAGAGSGPGSGTAGASNGAAGTPFGGVGTMGGAPGVASATGSVPGTGSGPAGSASTATSTGGSTAGASSGGSAPIRVGFVLQDASGASALVGSNVPITSTGRQQQIAQWLVDYVNKHGGVGGRKIVPTFEKVAVTDQESTRIADCQAMAQDQHDVAVMDMNEMLADDAWACFAHNHVDFFGNASGTDRKFLDANSPYITTTFMGLDRQMYVMAHGAASVGFFQGAKVGIILPDTPEGHYDMDHSLGPQLKAVGVKSWDARYITLTDGGGQTSQTNNAVLQFSTEGVNRVLFFHDILVYLQFAQQANAQGYYPRMAYPDFEGAAGVAAFYGSAKTNAGSIAVSSSPNYVVDNNSQNVKNAGTQPIPRNSVGPATQACLDILSKESGVNFYDPNQSQDPDLDSIYYCDELFLFVQGTNHLGAAFTPQSFGAGLRQVASYLSTQQNSAGFGSGHHDGALTYRVGNYDSSCSCFVKATAWLRAPA